jgi:copper chaperone CopZ
MASLKLTVAGMTCGHCRMKVEQALQGVAGTFGAAVFLEDAAAEVDYDPALASPEQYVAAVRDAGYQATPDA